MYRRDVKTSEVGGSAKLTEIDGREEAWHAADVTGPIGPRAASSRVIWGEQAEMLGRQAGARRVYCDHAFLSRRVFGRLSRRRQVAGPRPQ